MRKLIVALSICQLLIVTGVSAQVDSLQSSIAYPKTMAFAMGRESASKEDFRIDYKKLPEDLSLYTLIFIEISKAETKGNTGASGPFYKGYNKRITRKFIKLYPHKFVVLTNDYLAKDEAYFKELDYKYRVMIHVKFVMYKDSEGKNILKQLCRVFIENIETTERYGPFGYEWPHNFVKQFLKRTKT